MLSKVTETSAVGVVKDGIDLVVSQIAADKEHKKQLELERQREREEQAKAERKTMKIYAAVGAVCAVIAAAVLVINRGDENMAQLLRQNVLQETVVRLQAAVRDNQIPADF